MNSINEYLKSIDNIDKELIVPSDENFIISKIGNDKIILKDIFNPFDCYYNTSDPIKDQFCINIMTIRIDNHKWNNVKKIDPSFLESLILKLFEKVWITYKSDDGKYDKSYVFKHWILITMPSVFSKKGWNILSWYNKIISKDFKIPKVK